MALIASDIPGLDRDKFGFLFHFLTFQLLTSLFLFQSSLLKCVLCLNFQAYLYRYSAHFT